MTLDCFESEADVIIYRRTSLLESTAQTLVNTVNCVGVMGKGLAHAFKLREPSMFESYKKICDEKLLEPGRLWLWRGDQGWVLNFPTKKHWRGASQLEWIEQGLDKFVHSYKQQGISEISFPRLGCGNGGLSWDVVRPVMERYLEKVDIPVFIHDFQQDVGLPEHFEVISQTLKSTWDRQLTFESFLGSLVSAVRIIQDSDEVSQADEAIRISISEDHNLEIKVDDLVHRFDEDDLRGVWIHLLKGILTKERAGWVARESGVPLINLLSVLPHVRPIEIQKASDEFPERALELVPNLRKIGNAVDSDIQRSMSWR